MSHHRQLVNPPALHPAPGFSHVAVSEGDMFLHPPQTILGVTGLAVPGLLIEIECTAVVS